jgi:hypothetical protein
MKGDLDKDGKMSGYEQARQDAIEKNMREQKVIGGIVKAAVKGLSKIKSKKKKALPSKKKKDEAPTTAGTARTEEQAELMRQISEDADKLRQRGFSDARIEELLEEAYELGEPRDLLIALGRNVKQTGGSMDDQMQMAMGQNMLPDEEMEDNYLDFIIDEALTEEEESMLMSKLEQDEQLSMLFDKVIEVASEFAGSGPVEGPGSGVSDSIPARLSDGEFVFTAKATEQIGADELMRMMKDAEADADRQGMQEGGMMMEEEEVDQFGRPIDSDIARDELKKNMMSVNPRYR